MVREIITWCSPCYANDVRTEGRSVALAVDGRPQLVDVCETHDKEIVQPVRELLAAHGQPLERAGVEPTARERHRCPECGKLLKTRDTLSKHLRSMHGQSLKDALGDDDDDELPIEVDESSKPYGCPDCARRFETPQGLGAHRNRSHGYKSGDDERLAS
jgi:uncharacterized C2H2 Zn-finger protein